VLIVLAWARPRLRGVLGPAWLAVVGAFLFNEASYYLHYGELTPSALAIQIRTGLEYRYGLSHPTPEALWHDYQQFCARARTGSLIADYGWPRLIEHTLRDWLMFLRRPPVALALLLVALAGVATPRRLPRGVGLVALWILAYSLVLSPAYYTARSAALPALVGLGLALALAFTLAERLLAGYTARLALAVVVAVLLAGSLAASRYAQLVWRERMHYAALSRQIDGELARLSASRSSVITNDVRVLPLTDNPWGLPFAHTGMFWTDDPLVQFRQAPGLVHFSEAQVAAGPDGYDCLVLVRGQPSGARWEIIDASGAWEEASSTQEYVIYRRAPAAAGFAVSDGA